MCQAERGSGRFDADSWHAAGVGPADAVVLVLLLLEVVVGSGPRRWPGGSVGVAVEANVHAGGRHHGRRVQAGEHEAVRLQSIETG